MIVSEKGENVYRVNIYVETTIQAPAKKEARAMWLIEFVREQNPFDPVIRKGFVEFAETTEDQITLTALITALSRLTKECEICIFTKARNVLATLDTRRFESWRVHKWVNSSQNIVKNAELWEIFTELLEKHNWKTSIETHSFESLMKTELRTWQRA